MSIRLWTADVAHPSVLCEIVRCTTHPQHVGWLRRGRYVGHVRAGHVLRTYFPSVAVVIIAARSVGRP